MKAALAAFDLLALTGEVAGTVDGVTLTEMHTLDYLGCLLSIYDGNQPSWWSFSFSVTDTGAPFSRDLVEALDRVVAAGWLVKTDRVHNLSPRGREELAFQVELPLNARRMRYLQAASAAALTMALPSLAGALAHEPGLRRALTYLRRKELLDETSLNLVTQQFEALTEALGQRPQERADLMVPAVVWLTFLAQERQHLVGGKA